MAVYDDQKERTGTDDLRNITGISHDEEAAMNRSATSGAAEDIAKREGLFNAHGDDKKSLNKTELADKEKGSGKGNGAAQTATAAALGGPAGALANAAAKFAKNKKAQGGVLGGSVGIALISFIIASFIGLPALKVQHFANNWKTLFFANALEATDDMSDNLMSHYIVKKVVPGMVKNNCTTTRINRSCADVSGSNNIVSALYSAWSQNRVEAKWAENGFEIRREGNRFYVRSSALNQDLDLGTYNGGNSRAFEGRAFAQLSRSEVRQQLRTIYENETAARRVIMHFSVRYRIADKYGVRHCITACTTRDRLTENLELRQAAFKLYLAERILIPRSEMLGLAAQCAMSGFLCADPGEADQNGERLSQFERDLQARLLQYRSQYGTNSLQDLNDEAEKIRNDGFVQYAVKRLAGETVGKFAVKIIPFVGWLDMGSQLIAGAQNAGPAIKKMNYVMTSTSAVALFSMYATHADEIKTGNVDPDMVGSMAASFNENPANDQGGGAAEASPVYDTIMNDGGVRTASIIDVFMPSAYAQEQNKVKPHTCDNGELPPAGSDFCPEEAFGALSKVGTMAVALSEAANNPALALPGFAAKVWLATGGKVLNWIGSLFGDAIAALTPDQITELIGWITDEIFAKILVNPFSEKMSGGRIFAMGSVGAAAAGSDYAHYQLNAKVLTPEQSASNIQQQLDLRQAQFESRPLYARLFDTEESQSLVSRVAISTPASATQGAQSFSTMVINPLKTLATVLGSMFSTKQVWADANLYADMGVKPYGYPEDEPVLTQDPEKYWDENDCDNPDKKKEWGNKASVDELTGMDVHNVTNGCALLRVAIAGGGGKYDTALLEPRQSQPSGAGGGGTATGLVSGTPQQLAEGILTSGKVDIVAKYRYQIEQIADGNMSCNINPLILQLIATISQNHTVRVTSLNRYCTNTLTASGTGSLHYTQNGGHAVDFDMVDGVKATGSTPQDVALLREVIPFLPSGSEIGQVNCRSGANVLTVPAGIDQVNDTCNHVHIGVPPQ